MQAYTTLEARFARLSALEGALGILHWDTQTMMPEGSADERAIQIATLTSIAHELLTSPITRDLLDEARTERGSARCLATCKLTRDASHFRACGCGLDGFGRGKLSRVLARRDGLATGAPQQRFPSAPAPLGRRAKAAKR